MELISTMLEAILIVLPSSLCPFPWPPSRKASQLSVRRFFLEPIAQQSLNRLLAEDSENLQQRAIFDFVFFAILANVLVHLGAQGG